MKKLLSLPFVLLFICSLYAQMERGSIYGKVVDAENNPLPGVTVTLTGSLTAPIPVITSSEGLFRFLTLAPARDYAVKAVLEGFKTKVIENIGVVFGQNVNVNITMELGVLSEEITVTAERPLIDKKKTEVGLIATQEVLQELPVARDIWTMEKMAPAAHSRYWNVGGSESLEQDAGTARGDPDHYLTTYAVDGINISDMAALGSTANYLNFDAIEELRIVIGGAADVTQQTSGLTTNAITKRGGNKHSFGTRFFFSDNALQGNNLTDKKKEAGVRYMMRIDEMKDLGFNYGFPIIRDKAWLFLAYDYQEVKKYTVYNKADNAFQWSYDLKLNLQLIPQNRLEAYIRGAVKKRFGDEPFPERPEGLYKGPRDRFGGPLYKFQDEHTFGDNLYVTAKFVTYGGWSSWVPMTDIDQVKLSLWNIALRKWDVGSSGSWSNRPDSRFQFLADYYNDNLFGVAHQFRIGGEYAHHGTISESGYAGNALVRYNYNEPTVDYTGDGKPDIYPSIQRLEVQRGSYSSSTTQAYALFAQDTITFKNFNISLGLRYDYQWPRVDKSTFPAVIKDHPVWKEHFTLGTTDAIDRILPALQIDEIGAFNAEKKDYYWANLSPRFSFSWDLKGDGKTVLKLSAATYYYWMESGYGSAWRKGGTGGWMAFWWLDANSDQVIDLRELYWHNSKNYSIYRALDDAGNMIGNLTDAAGIMYGSYDPLNPGKTTDPYTLVDGKVGAPRTIELQLVFEKEIFRDFSISISPNFRRYDKWSWDLLYFPATGQIESRDWYMSAGRPAASIPGIGDTKDAKNHDWYVLKPEYGYTAWKFRKPRPEYHIDYYGIDFVFTKRLSSGWMFNGSFTLGDQRVHYGEKGVNNPTNQWAVEGKNYATISASEPTRWTPGRYDNPLWMAKAMALYQLPLGIDISLTFNAQEGRDVRESFDIVDTSLPNPRSNSATLYMASLGTLHSDTIALLNLRLQKRLKFENSGEAVFMLDVMNLLNSDCIHWRSSKDYGKYTVQSGTFSANPSFYIAQDSFGARIARIGVRFTF